MPGYTVTRWDSTGVPVPGYTGRYYWSLEVAGPDGQLAYKYDQFNLAGNPPAQPLPNSYIQAGWLNGFSKSFNGVSFGDNQVARMRFLNQDRKSVVSGKSVSVRVDLGGRRIIKKKKNNITIPYSKHQKKQN